MLVTPLFLSSRKSTLYAVTYLPEDISDLREVFIFCHPLFEEKKSTHRFFVELAEKLFTEQRGAALVEKNKEYVQAARLIGRGSIPIMFRHILPNVLSPVLVIATISLALAIIAEATLSFLGVGAPSMRIMRSPGGAKTWAT